MANFRVQMFFEYGVDGWTDTLLWVGQSSDTIDTVMEECISIGGLCDYRCNLLGKGAQFKAIRISQDGVWRDSRIEEAESNSILASRVDNSKNNANFTADHPTAVTRLRCEVGSSFRAIHYLSGMPQALQPEPALLLYPEPWQSNFEKYTTYLANKGKHTTRWGAYVQDKPDLTHPPILLGAIPVQADLDLTGVPNKLALSFGTDLTGVTKGNRIRLLGVKATLDANGVPTDDARKWNGRFLVTDVTDAKHIKVAIKQQGIATLPLLDWSGANVFLPGTNAYTFDKVRKDGQATHRRGRPISAHRGRR